MFLIFFAADGSLRIDISVHERDLENMAKGERLSKNQKEIIIIKKRDMVKQAMLINSNSFCFDFNLGSYRPGLATIFN